MAQIFGIVRHMNKFKCRTMYVVYKTFFELVFMDSFCDVWLERNVQKKEDRNVVSFHHFNEETKLSSKKKKFRTLSLFFQWPQVYNFQNRKVWQKNITVVREKKEPSSVEKLMISNFIIRWRCVVWNFWFLWVYLLWLQFVWIRIWACLSHPVIWFI